MSDILNAISVSKWMEPNYQGLYFKKMKSQGLKFAVLFICCEYNLKNTWNSIYHITDLVFNTI